MIISIPGVPPSLNELRRKYRTPHAYRKLRDQWQHDLFYGASCARHRNELITLATRHRMHVEVTEYRIKMLDQDNLIGSVKPLLDAMKNIGYIEDDDPKHVHVEVVQLKVSRKELRTVVKIYPIIPQT